MFRLLVSLFLTFVFAFWFYPDVLRFVAHFLGRFDVVPSLSFVPVWSLCASLCLGFSFSKLCEFAANFVFSFLVLRRED